MEDLQHDLDNLYNDMRQTNVRSNGLKVSLHEAWCQRLKNISERYQKANQAALVAATSLPPPPPPPTT